MRKAQQLTVLIILVFGTSSLANAQTFGQTCPSPSFPSNATPIDSACNAAGQGGKEAAQNQAKNNFCAQGEPQETTFDQLKRLQVQVDNNHSIPFGRAGTATRQPGPATQRSALQQIGEGKLVVLKAFVLKARQEGAESVNCGKPPHAGAVPDEPVYHDIHIALVPVDSEKDECNGVVAEMSPHHRPAEWTADNVNKIAASHSPVRVTGQLFFDSSHSPCENGQATAGNPKRFSLWEIHPIYKFEVCTGDCSGAGVWVSLEAWVEKQQ
jgi:hypothetical protein